MTKSRLEAVHVRGLCSVCYQTPERFARARRVLKYQHNAPESVGAQHASIYRRLLRRSAEAQLSEDPSRGWSKLLLRESFDVESPSRKRVAQSLLNLRRYRSDWTLLDIASITYLQCNCTTYNQPAGNQANTIRRSGVTTHSE